MVHVQVIQVPVWLECRKADDFKIVFSHKNEMSRELFAPVFCAGRVGSPSGDLFGRIVSPVDGADGVGEKAGPE